MSLQDIGSESILPIYLVNNPILRKVVEAVPGVLWGQLYKTLYYRWGRWDLNPGPPAPQAGILAMLDDGPTLNLLRWL